MLVHWWTPEDSGNLMKHRNKLISQIKTAIVTGVNGQDGAYLTELQLSAVYKVIEHFVGLMQSTSGAAVASKCSACWCARMK